MGYQKKRETKKQKLYSSKKQRRDRKKGSYALSKRKLEEGKFSKGVPLPPNTTHLHILIILYDLLLLVIQVFDLAINKIQVSLAFYPLPMNST